MSGYLLSELAKTRAELAATKRRLKVAREGRAMWKREALGYRAIVATQRSNAKWRQGS